MRFFSTDAQPILTLDPYRQYADNASVPIEPVEHAEPVVRPEAQLPLTFKGNRQMTSRSACGSANHTAQIPYCLTNVRSILLSIPLRFILGTLSAQDGGIHAARSRHTI
jgi:hypothetical protein